jgi:hypothetical protein
VGSIPAGDIKLYGSAPYALLIRKNPRSENQNGNKFTYFRGVWRCRIKQQRKELKKQGTTKKPIRGKLRDQLRWLGALRVKEHYPRKSLVNDPFPKLKVRAPFSNLPDLYTAAKYAKQIIDGQIQRIKKLAESR